jgi:hypothetical protein
MFSIDIENMNKNLKCLETKTNEIKTTHLEKFEMLVTINKENLLKAVLFMHDLIRYVFLFRLSSFKMY